MINIIAQLNDSNRVIQLWKKDSVPDSISLLDNIIETQISEKDMTRDYYSPKEFAYLEDENKIVYSPSQEDIINYRKWKFDAFDDCEILSEATCELGDLVDINSTATEDLSDAAVELGDLVDESVNTNIDLIDAVTELGDLVAEQADIIAQLQEIIEQLTSGE